MPVTETDIRIIYQNQSASTVQYLLASLEDENITTVELADRHIELTTMLTEGALEATAALVKQFDAKPAPARGNAGSSGGRSYSGGSSKRASASTSSDDPATDKQVAFAVRLLEEAGEDADRDELAKMTKKKISSLIEELNG